MIAMKAHPLPKSLSAPRLQAVILHQAVIQGDILIKKTEAFDAIFADSQQARDDWR